MLSRLKNNLQRCAIFALYSAAIFLAILILMSPSRAQNRPSALLLKISGGIGPATGDFIERGLKHAEETKAKLVILQIDTPGGLSKSMRDIIKNILSSPIPVVGYVAPSGARAASAGTYILYASHIAAMAPGTNLGAATPVSIGSPGMPNDKSKEKGKEKSKGMTASQKKALNDARAYIRSLAQLRGRNVKWAERAVLHGESLSAIEALKNRVIDLIAKDIPTLLKKINGMTVSVRGEKQTINSTGLSVQSFLPDWRTKFLAVITDPSVAYILLMIGFYGLFFEFVNPGFIVPGVVGAICLLIGLYALALLPISYAGLSLIVLGLAFIIAEAFMPSFGALGIGGVISFVIGSIMLLRTDVAGFTIPIYLIITVAVVTVGFLLLVMNMAFRSHRKPVVSGREQLIGEKGLVDKTNGRSWIRIEGERWQCKSENELQAGQEVVVKRVDGVILIVEPIQKASQEQEKK